MCPIIDADGREYRLGLQHKITVVAMWKLAKKRGVPAFYQVRADIVLTYFTTRGTNAVAEPSREDFERAVELVQDLPRDAKGLQIVGLFYALRNLGYRLFQLNGKGEWRALDAEGSRYKVGPMRMAYVRLALGELRITSLADPDIKTGFGRILERPAPEEPTQTSTEETEQVDAGDVVDESRMVYLMQQVAATAVELGIDEQVVEHQGVCVRADKVPYEVNPDFDPARIPLLITAKTIQERILNQMALDQMETVTQAIWALLGTRIPIDHRWFVKARKRFSTVRQAAESALYSSGARPGTWHDRMEPVPKTGHRSKTIHWTRRQA